MRLFAVLLIALAVAACSGSDKQETAGDTHTHDAGEATAAHDPHAGHDHTAGGHGEAAVAVDLATREVKCGCAIESIGTCGNYVDIDGSWAYIANSTDLGLGSMEWCGAEETVMAETKGELKGSKFHALTLTVATTD